MTLTAAATGFVVFLLCLMGIHSQTWGVEYASKHICAFEGSTVEISCTYTYPPWISYKKTVVQREFWYAKLKDKNPLDLREDPDYAGRVTSHCSEQSCSLRISGLRLNDSAEFKFKFETNQPDGSFTGKPGVFLTVTDLQVLTIKTQACLRDPCALFELTCHSRCVPPHSSYVWYKNGKIITDGSQQKYSAYIYAADSVSCAVRGHESFHSPAVCVYGSSCNKVTYTEGSICAFRGSTVTISCSFQIKSSDSSDSWFSVRGQQSYYQNTGGHDSSENRFQVKNDQYQSSLTISDLTDSDADEYRFKTTWWGRNFPGTTLTVVDPRVQVIKSFSGLELVCHSSCFPLHHLSFIWFMNGQKVQGETSDFYRKPVSPEASYSCSYQGQRSPEVYAPKSVSVSMSLTEIMEGSSVTLTCSCDANPAAKFRWYKNNQTLLRKDQSLILSSVQRSDSGKFHCVAENELGEAASDHVFINVEYPPEPSSVSVSPSAEVLEGSSVTLTCSSDANPAANYTWFKDNRTLLSEDKVHFSSIRSEHSGNYSCKSENKHGQSSSTPLFLDVQYPPRIPSVSVFGKISKGSSVTLTCSSDANPAANFSWFKKDEDSPKASGPNWTISDFRAEHSGFYYCEAENRRGSLNSSLQLIEAETDSWKSAATATTTFAVLLFVFIPAFIWIKKNRRVTEQQEKRPANRSQLNTSPDINSPSAETEAAGEQLELHYSSIHFSKNQEECLYSNIRRNPKPRQRPEDNSVEYSAVGFKKSAEAKKPTEAEHSEDFALYSTVNKVSS
uniref:Ig-like domain-containing protein n=1 Tax=Oryzias latipes TaxID=8090 RepID=A0A3P9MM33_ORYLA